MNGYRSDVLKHQETSDRLTQEMTQLQSRYDAISEVKERAVERYKVDYQKWRKFKNWLFTLEEGKGKDGRELSAEEKKRRRNRNVLVKKELLMELGPDYANNYADGDVNGGKYYLLFSVSDSINLHQRRHYALHLWVGLHHYRKTAIPRMTKRIKPLPIQRESDDD